MKQPRWTWSTIAIVIAIVALVFGPVFIPREVSRWYLAAAANAYRGGDRTLGQHYLERAIDWDGSVVSDRDFWMAQMDRTNSDEVLDLLEKAIRQDPYSAAMASRVAVMFIEEFDYQRAVRAMKMAFPDGQPQDAQDLNELAYVRAQAGVELDQALKDINQAIKMVPNEPGLWDTKAWVLHGMHRDREALDILDDAIKEVEKKVGRSKEKSSAQKKIPQKKSAEGGAEPDSPTEETAESHESLSQTEQLRKRIQTAKARLGLEMWTVAIIRFHRLRVYEALHQSKDARRERQWLLEHGVPIADELF